MAIGKLVIYQLTNLPIAGFSEGFSGEDDRFAEAEAAQIPADDVEIADDERRQTRRIEVACHHPRHLVAGDALDPRDELLEIVVRQVVERELQGGAPDLLAGLEAARIAARQRRDAERELVGGDRTRAADAGNLADRFADGR